MKNRKNRPVSPAAEGYAHRPPQVPHQPHLSRNECLLITSAFTWHTKKEGQNKKQTSPSSYSPYYAEACNELAVPISAS